MDTKKYKILILEDDVEWSSQIQVCLNQSSDFTVSLATNSVTKALECVKTSCPAAVIVDLQLNAGEGDGITFLNCITNNEENLPMQPYKLVVTDVTSSKTIAKLNMGLADNILCKQSIAHDPEYILDYLRLVSDVFDCNTKPEHIVCRFDKSKLIHERVKAELDNYYIKQTSVGLDYLIDAICMVIESPENEEILITKTIYPTLAKKYRKESPSVDRAIDRVIQNAFSKTDENDIRRVYPPYLDLGRCAPSNKEFIVYIANKIKAENIY